MPRSMRAAPKHRPSLSIILPRPQDYAKAFSLAEKWDEKLKWNYKNLEAEALNAHGNEKGDNGALEKSIATYEALLTFIPNGEKNDDWAITRNNMGVAYQTLGERASDGSKLEQAARIFRDSLQVLTREHDPVNWAAAQNNLGNSLLALGQSETDPKSLEEAVAAFRAVLGSGAATSARGLVGFTEQSRHRPLFAGRERKQRYAASRSRSRLSRRPRSGRPRPGAVALGHLQNNLGNTLNTLGARKNDLAMLKESATVFRSALEVRTRERVPVQWGNSMVNLGNALHNIGLRDNGAGRTRGGGTRPIAMRAQN